MGKTKREPSREESFHKHYAAIWGEERWHGSLYPALARLTRHAALINQAVAPSSVEGALEASGLSHEDLEPVSLPCADESVSSAGEGSICFARRLTEESEEGMRLIPPRQCQVSHAQGALMSHWNLDAASVLAASLLSVQLGHAVLDLCAAPGGKSITLAQRLFLADDHLVDPSTTPAESSSRTLLCSNEADKTRFCRLAENLKAYLLSSLPVKCTNVDATSPHAHRELAIAGGWDKVLIDAPCSSERHIIHAHIKAQTSGRAAPEMVNWRPGSTKRLQETQIKLLMTALRLVKNHGTVLYATCSIEPGENDGVVEKVLAQVEKERKKGLITWNVQLSGPSAGQGNETLQQQLRENWAEPTKYGWIALPDHPSGGRWGPLFFAVLAKMPGD